MAWGKETCSSARGVSTLLFNLRNKQVFAEFPISPEGKDLPLLHHYHQDFLIADVLTTPVCRCQSSACFVFLSVSVSLHHFFFLRICVYIHSYMCLCRSLLICVHVNVRKSLEKQVLIISQVLEDKALTNRQENKNLQSSNFIDSMNASQQPLIC